MVNGASNELYINYSNYFKMKVISFCHYINWMQEDHYTPFHVQSYEPIQPTIYLQAILNVNLLVNCRFSGYFWSNVGCGIK